jgi:hypothetical protein
MGNKLKFSLTCFKGILLHSSNFCPRNPFGNLKSVLGSVNFRLLGIYCLVQKHQFFLYGKCMKLRFTLNN